MLYQNTIYKYRRKTVTNIISQNNEIFQYKKIYNHSDKLEFHYFICCTKIDIKSRSFFDIKNELQKVHCFVQKLLSRLLLNLTIKDSSWFSKLYLTF